jgi:signal transduction histidine kinase
LQDTVDKAVEFTRSFSHFAQPAVCANSVDIGEIVGFAISSAVSVHPERKAVLQNIEAAAGFKGRLVQGDAFLLELAFHAILSNALEATHNGNQILVSAATDRDTFANRDLIRIVIADAGDGIEPDMLARVADPFFSSKRDRDGLGLSTALRVIEMHGGALKISSARGNGTQVEVLLPLVGRSKGAMDELNPPPPVSHV